MFLNGEVLACLGAKSDFLAVLWEEEAANLYFIATFDIEPQKNARNIKHNIPVPVSFSLATIPAPSNSKTFTSHLKVMQLMASILYWACQTSCWGRRHQGGSPYFKKSLYRSLVQLLTNHPCRLIWVTLSVMVFFQPTGQGPEFTPSLGDPPGRRIGP